MSDRAFSLRFALYALGALLLSAALALVLTDRRVTRDAERQVSRDARLAATMLAASAPPGAPGRPLSATQRTNLRRALGSGFAYAKVIRDGRVVLATDPGLLAPLSAEDAADVKHALAGTATGHRSDEHSRDTVEAAAPIVVRGVTVGVLEVGEPWAPVAAQIRHDFLLRAGSVLGALLLLYAALIPILRRLLRDRRRAAGGVRLADAIVENADEGIVVLDAEGRVEFANPKLVQLLGYAPDEMAGRPLADFAVSAPDGRARQELQLRRADGSTLWTLVSTHALGDGGGAVALVADIDELKGSERSLHGATRRLSAIVAAQREIAGLELDLDAALGTLLERTRELTGADAVELGHVDGDAAVSTVSVGPAPHVGERVPLHASLTGLCIRTGEVITSADVANDERAFAPRRVDPTTRSVVIVPVRAEGLNGALAVIYARPSAFDDEVVETTRLMAEFASATLRNAAELRAKQQLLAALAESEERFRNAVESSPIGFALCTPDDRYVVVNEAFCRIVGRTRAELDVLTWRDLTHPDDLAAEEELTQRLLAAEMPHFEVEKRFVRGDGETIWVRSAIALIRGEDGAPRYGVAQIQDVTERLRLEHSARERERLFRAVFEQSVVANVLADDEGVVMDANEASAALVDLPRAAFVGRRLAEFAPADRNELEEAWQRLRLEGKAEGEVEIVTPARRRRRVVFAGRADVQPGLHLVTVQDVTEQRALEERSRQGQKMEAVGRLAGGVAHDFNNMLTAIIGYSDLLLAGLDPETAEHRHAGQVNQAAQRASTLTRQLLAFSRRQVLRPAVVDLSESIDRMRDMLTRLIGEDVRLETRLDRRAEPVLADESQIEQVIVNLAVNARDAMPRGGVLAVETATVNVDPEQARDAIAVPGRYSTITIRDTGVGMDAEQLARLFEPFYTTKGAAGTGLGLATVYGIVRQSGGFLTVESEPGAGSAFRIHLPATAVPAADEGPVEHEAPTGGSETVLLVEDEELVRGIVGEMLRQSGYSVLTAADGEEAVRVAAEHPRTVDLLLTDVVMPGMSGQEVARLIADGQPGIRTLFVSGYNEGAIANHGVLAPGTFFLQKPFSSSDLAAKVREVLDATPVA